MNSFRALGLVGCALLLGALGAFGCATAAVAPEIGPPSAMKAADVEQVQRAMVWRLVEEGDYDRALPQLRGLLAQYPRDPGLRLLLGIVLREKQMHGPALAELKLVVRWRPDSARAHAALGVLLDQLSRHDEAERHHRRAVALRPGVAAYHNNLGFCLFLNRRRPEAKEELELAIRLDPTLRRAYNNLGFVRGLDDDEEEALRAFRQAGSQAMAWTNMGLVAELRGRPQRARLYYERALREQPGFSAAQRNLRALEPQVDRNDAAGPSGATVPAALLGAEPDDNDLEGAEPAVEGGATSTADPAPATAKTPAAGEKEKL
ncbi:MAG: tetratricopeptide repeat protein [Proteobacteria bacterium]|nr:tetratricopeptide repeat protein [Pseudomonadota bacterium]